MKKGFTLMELIIVVVIVGILAMVGLPQYFRVAERGRASEGFAILGAMRSAQIRYAAENPAGTTTGSRDELDMDLVAPKFFALPTPTAGSNPRSANTNMGSITRTGGYTMSIDSDGDITCVAGGTVICPPMPH